MGRDTLTDKAVYYIFGKPKGESVRDYTRKKAMRESYSLAFSKMPSFDEFNKRRVITAGTPAIFRVEGKQD